MGVFKKVFERFMTTDAPSDDGAEPWMDEPPVARAAPSFPFPVETMPGDLAMARWHRLRDEDGVTPVLLGDFGAMEEHASAIVAPEVDTPTHLARAAALDVGAWLREEAQDYRLAALSDGRWPAPARPLTQLNVPLDRAGAPLPAVGVAELPTRSSWEAAAWLQFGGWNSCPPTPVHVALWRTWADRFGAQVVCITGSQVEFVVDRPPRTREAALALAREHLLYCDDQVIQNHGSLEGLAAALLDAPVWYFWWD